MTFGFGQKRSDADPQPIASNEPQAKEPALRETVRVKLKELVERGDVGAIRLAIDHPELLSGPDLDPPKAQADMVSVPRGWYESVCKLLSWLDELSKRRERTGADVEFFHESVERRLKYEDHLIALAGWQRMSTSERMGLWNELVTELHNLGVLVREHHEFERLVQ
jgi:hypothetical protein